MTWCFSTRASVPTVLTAHTCIFRCSWVNPWWAELFWENNEIMIWEKIWENYDTHCGVIITLLFPFSHMHWNWDIQNKAYVIKINVICIISGRVLPSHIKSSDRYKKKLYDVCFKYKTLTNFHGILHGISWSSMKLEKHKLKFHGIPWNFESEQNSTGFHETSTYVAQVSWNSMEPQMLFKYCFKKSHGTFFYQIKLHRNP